MSDKSADSDRESNYLRLAAKELGATSQRVHQRLELLHQSNQRLEDFTRAASHDIKAPLRQIRQLSELLLEDDSEALSGDGREKLERIANAAERLGNYIQNLLEFARLGSLHERPPLTNLLSVAQDVVADLSGTFEGEVALSVEQLPALHMHETHVYQVLTNLISNAYKYRRDDVTPEIRVTAERLSSGEKVRGAVWRVSVIDNGIGFSPAQAEEAFLPFRRLQASSDAEGSGMGLCIVRRIVETYGGAIWADGCKGEGAVFTIEIPADYHLFRE